MWGGVGGKFLKLKEGAQEDDRGNRGSTFRGSRRVIKQKLGDHNGNCRRVGASRQSSEVM